MSKPNALSLNAAEESYTEDATKPQPVIGFWKIAFAIFVGNILTGVVGAIVYEAVTH